MIGFDWSEWAILRFVGASFIFWLCYYLLFDRKAPFSQCRIYLLYSVLLAGIVSTVRIPVYPVEVQTMKVQPVVEISQRMTPQVIKSSSTPTSAIEEIRQSKTLPATTSEENEKLVTPLREDPLLQNESSLQKEPFYSYLNYWVIAKCIYGLGVLVLLLYLLTEMIRIWRLKRWGSHTVDADGICIVRNSHVVSPFSFFRTIFINRKIEGEVLHIVLLHEKAHISNHHYRDTFFIEYLCILCWFNPFVWLIKRELRLLHEFQVDRKMLSDDIELFNYQRILFEELMGYSPNIANSFHNSLIKKRFIMMKYQYKDRFALLRKMALLFLLAGMTALFSFTEKPVYTIESTPSVQKVKQEVMIIQCPDDIQETNSLIKEEVLENLEPEVVINAEKRTAPTTSPFLKTIEMSPEGNIEEEVAQKMIVKEDENEAELRPDQQVISRIPYSKSIVVRFVERANDETRVIVAIPIHWGRHWIQFEKGLSIVDEDTKDIYRIRSVTRDIELNKVYWVNGMEDRMAEFTLIFPPLNKKVKEISIRDCFPEEKAMTPPNSSSWSMDNINIRELVPTHVRMEEYDKEGRPLRADFPGEVTLRPEQVGISPYQRGGTQIVKIVPSKENTLVVLSLPVYYDRHWFTVGKGLCIIDCKTGTEYPIQGVTNGIEMNKLLWVEGCKGRSILMTLVFPKLDEKVKMIDLYSKYPDANIVSPTNGNKWRWEKIKIKDYQTENHNNVYL